MKKPLIILLLSLIILIPVWIGYKEIRRNKMLSSGRNVLLIDKSAGIYSYSELMERDDITRAFKVIDYAENIDDQELGRRTEGLVLIGTIEAIPSPDIDVQIPEAAQEAGWQEALSFLTEEQLRLCSEMDRADFAQQCTLRHYIFYLKNQAAQISECDRIFIDAYKQECRVALQTEMTETGDADNNGLLDVYEFYANPEAFNPDPL